MKTARIDVRTDIRTDVLIRVLLGCALFLGIVLAAIDIYSLVSCTDTHASWKTLHRIALTDSIFLVIALGIANFLFIKFRKQRTQDIQHTDSLTGLVTRHAFGEIFEHALLDAKRTLEPLSVLIVDIDHFRGINERYGHKAGDALLSMLSKSIQSVLRASDITCRWEGDQFLVVLKECSTKDSCRIAAKILEMTRSLALKKGEDTIKISISIGIAQMVSDDNIETLTARAETGLYSARDNGRNGCAVGYDWILINYACEPILLPA
ncbi:diguanylate cyclase (GGDEF) domain-containing protein [Desulfocapsa sulfexigens DSM 10523]|uniref:diguanylate cyclase n=1 Tax=Desulfocapsa sulfexigens (strain DSM 10523 / SB164P1) TaxID=1167006 RepID=M1NIM4_DESSD|nr:GGDEF domain-containing protein [Desulfocapsa sulfexigens]AGF79419.1 diguanylate cyclase (GGDEF) domain-containing protein [Desulfocapsa sulfexigens DSM 10523]